MYERAEIATSGPLPAGHEVRGKQIVCSFTHCTSGLQARGGELSGFSIAGEDRQWKPATAVIQGNQVIVTHSEIDRPVAVRYAWQADLQCNLVNGAGLPASPFRTDDWSD